MPRTKEKEEKAEIVRVRLSSKVRERITKARLAGVFGDEAESTFMGYLVKLGIEKYEKTILPLEREENESPAVPAMKKKNVS